MSLRNAYEPQLQQKFDDMVFQTHQDRNTWQCFERTKIATHDGVSNTPRLQHMTVFRTHQDRNTWQCFKHTKIATHDGVSNAPRLQHMTVFRTHQIATHDGIIFDFYTALSQMSSDETSENDSPLPASLPPSFKEMIFTSDFLKSCTSNQRSFSGHKCSVFGLFGTNLQLRFWSA